MDNYTNENVLQSKFLTIKSTLIGMLSDQFEELLVFYWQSLISYL